MGLSAREAILEERDTFGPHPELERYGNIVPFGIAHIDDAFGMGVEPTVAQMYGIQGQGGARKTSFVLNIIINQCLSGTLPENHRIIIDTLENGMSIERYLMTMRMIIATKILIYERWSELKCKPTDTGAQEYCWKLFNQTIPPLPASTLINETSTIINGQKVTMCIFTVDNIKLWYRGKLFFTEEQLYAWDLAGEAMVDFPVEVFGVSEHPDGEKAAERSDDTIVLEEAEKRWAAIAEHNSVQLIVDYVQEFFVRGQSEYYDKLLVILPHLSAFVKQTRSTVWVISQETISNDAEFRRSGRVLGAQGGNSLRNACQTNWRIDYQKDSDKYHIRLFAPVKSRRGNHGDLLLNVEPMSGALFGQSVEVPRK